MIIKIEKDLSFIYNFLSNYIFSNFSFILNHINIFINIFLFFYYIFNVKDIRFFRAFYILFFKRKSVYTSLKSFYINVLI